MLAIAHLSDIHFRSDRSNLVSDRVPALASAISSVARDATSIVVLVSGDIAFSGSIAEFEIAERFFAILQSELQSEQKIRTPLHWIAVPGNHDCNHTLANQLRRAAISREASAGRPDASTLALANEVLRPFEEFAIRRFSTGSPVHSLIYTHSIEDRAGHRVFFYTVNAAWCSTDPEIYGDLWLPADAVQAIRPQDAAVTITVMHYPLGWFDIETRRPLKRAVDVSSQLVITGHEHHPETERVITADGFQCERVAGGRLQGDDAPNESHFAVLLINTKTLDLTHYAYSWNSQLHRYEYGSLVKRTQLVKRRETLGPDLLDTTSHFDAFLDDLGMPISHPNPRARSLSDFFIWPDVALWIGKLGDTRQIVSSYQLLQSTDKSFVIAGTERAGKTSLGKQLLTHWRTKGLQVLWMDMPRVSRAFALEVDSGLTVAIEEQFGAGAAEAFLQMPPDRKAIIIDDFHLLSAEVNREELLRALRSRFATIVLLVSDDWVTDQTASRESFPELFSLQVARIVPCGPLLRHELVSRWVNQIPSLRHNPAEAERKVEHLVSLLDRLLGQDLVVPYPATLLVMLQSLSAHGRGEVNHGSLGHTYQVLIYTRVAEGATLAEVNMRLRFLTDFAWRLFVDQGQPLSHERMGEWHRAHMSNFNLGSEADGLPSDLRSCGMLDDRGGEWHFRHKYVYFYFVAEHISHNLHQAAIQDVLKGLVLRLHHEDASNVFSFVAFKSRNDAVLQMLVDRANTLFPDLRECNIAEDCRTLDTMARDVPQLVFAQEGRKSVRTSMLVEQDGEERKDEQSYSPKIREATAEEVDEYSNMLLTAIRLITVLGQVVRNHAGQLEADKMEWLVETTYALAMRTLSSFLEAAENSQERLVKDVVAALKERSPGISLGNLQIQVSRKLILLIEFAAYSLLRHTASSVGLGELMGRTLEAVRSRSANSTVELIDTAIELDRARMFPRARVLALGNQFHSNPFAFGVLGIMCWMNFHLYRVPEQDRQSVCEKLKIKHDRPQALSSRSKLPVTRVTRRSQYKSRRKRSRGR